ncbi:hypothetical protein pneo_cds_905 [Pandoravirus neocaledonia]|uniref:Uncharacterized protein n=1 Tax=Pandoravirus neocaledonia TaxID=2107708 RepID=A0A2U7UDM7_9VIRU|nr:hypothetical protein pneo_cds_905 [Pandoravirus neocaledonia]AVK76512.1 hypothetical protein pneo_cds_905 [Pandoravirus neocaledonia]
MADTTPVAPKRRFAKRTNRGLRAASIAAAAIGSLMPPSETAPSDGHAVSTATPADDAMDIANQKALACGVDSTSPDVTCAAKDGEAPIESDVVAAAPVESAQRESTPLDDGAIIALLDSVLADPKTTVVTISCSKQKRPRDYDESADDAPVGEDLQGPFKKARVDPDDQADKGHDGGDDTARASLGGADGAPDDAENRMDVAADTVAAFSLPADESANTYADNGYNQGGAVDESGNQESRDQVNEQEEVDLYDEEAAMRAYEASVAALDCYREATKRNGLMRLYILIEYLTALVGCGHCASFEIGPETPSLKRVTFSAMGEGRASVGTLQRVAWTVRGGSVPVTKGTALRPFGTAVGSLVADPDTLRALYADWAPALNGRGTPTARNRIVLRLVLTRNADRRVACRPLAWLMDDCRNDADAQTALPAGRQRVSVRLDALWRRYLAHDDTIKKAAVQAGLYRCGMSTATTTTRPGTAAPVTPGLISLP